MLPSSDLKNSALRTIAFSVLHSPAHRHRYRRFADALTDAAARLAETCDWFHLHVRRLSLPTFRPVSLALQIRACPLRHPAPRSGRDGTPLELPCRADACDAGNPALCPARALPAANSRCARPFAPPTPPQRTRCFVRRFLRYYGRVRLLPAVRPPLGSCLDFDGPDLAAGAAGRPPRSRCWTHVRALRSRTPRSPAAPRQCGTTSVAFDSNDGLGTPNDMDFGAQCSAHTRRCQRFIDRLTAANA